MFFFFTFLFVVHDVDHINKQIYGSKILRWTSVRAFKSATLLGNFDDLVLHPKSLQSWLSDKNLNHSHIYEFLITNDTIL